MRPVSAKRLLAAVLAVVLTFGCVGVPAFAAGSTSYGEPETVNLSSQNTLARENNFNSDWKFYLGNPGSAQDPGFGDSSWKNVQLPHDFSIFQSFTSSGEAESGFLPGGTGWYRKHFTLPEDCAGKTLLLNFDGAYSDATVYVNGTQVGEHHYGYTSFAFDISPYVTCDGVTENVLAVKVVNSIPSSRWYSGSGLYRDVTLYALAPVHVDYRGVQVTTPNVAKSGSAAAHVDVTVKNDSNADCTVTMQTQVFTMDGRVASNKEGTSIKVKAGDRAVLGAEPTVENAALWDIDSPNLYVVRTELYDGDTLLDTCETTFGFRYYSFDSTGFHLNGRNVKLNGVCLHHDQGALGSAAEYDAMYRQLSIMKDMGVNAIRTSHNPADEHFIDICNELGLLVIEEAFDGWNVAKNGNSYDFARYFSSKIGSSNLLGSTSSMTWAQYAAESMVKRDRNDPCVIAWSLGNEIQEGGSTSSQFPTIASNLVNWIKALDSRPTTIGDNTRGGNTTLNSVVNTIVNNGGIAGYNYANSASELYNLAKNYGGVIIAAETSSATNSRGKYQSQTNNGAVDGKYHLTSYDTSSVSWGIPAHDSIYNTYQYDCIAGEFVWTGFDYIGEPTPWNGTSSGDSGRGAIPNSSYFGIVETTGFEKDSYYLYRSQWNKDATTLHLVTAWDSDNMMTTGGKTPVWIYSNAPVVKLYRDGNLIGTATRQEHRSSAGHVYYTYDTQSNNSVCSAVKGSGSSALYAVFNVTYTSGTISAKAFDTKENEIPLTGNSGRNSVSTPGAVSKLVVSQNKTEIAADGSSLVYISVDVTDANGNLDTTAANTVNFALSGDGEIVGVDNGDQATTAKYQQSSVLKSATSANIKAYAGKALVIVRSTKDAGSFTVTASSSGLTGGSATVSTYPVYDQQKDGLVAYTMVRDYTVKFGTKPTLLTEAVGILANGEELTGEIRWEEAGDISMPGDYTMKGELVFDGFDPIAVTARLHVLDNVIALRNISTATTPNAAPTLPDTVRGVLADGKLSGEFPVTWDRVTGEQFANVGDIVVVKGEAEIMNERLSVTASVRVAQAVNTESANVAGSASALEQDIPAGYQSDRLESIRNDILKPGDNTNERWTNWNYRTRSASATLTFRWDTAQVLSGVNLYYYYDNCSAKPESVQFQYSLNGNDFVTVKAEEALAESYSLGAQYRYTFDQPVNPVALKITLTQQSGTTGAHCVGLTECQIMTFAGKLELNSAAELDLLQSDRLTKHAEPGVYVYEMEGSEMKAVTAHDNAAVTMLPAVDGVVRILTLSEDGSAENLYVITLTDPTDPTNPTNPTDPTGPEICEHKNTEVRDARQATCTEPGYTGDTYCLDCGDLIEAGKEIAAKGHSWNSGEITKKPTLTEEGERTYTCTACGVKKTEKIPKLSPSKKPSVTLSVTKEPDRGTMCLTGQFVEYENRDEYPELVAHGIIFCETNQVRGNLTVNTAGRTRVNFSGYKEDGSFIYHKTPASGDTKYTVRAFLEYVDKNGKTIFVYSDAVITTYDKLK